MVQTFTPQDPSQFRLRGLRLDPVESQLKPLLLLIQLFLSECAVKLSVFLDQKDGPKPLRVSKMPAGYVFVTF